MPLLRALAAQAIVLAALAAVRFLASFHVPLLAWAAAQAVGAAALGRRWGLGRYWLLFQAALPIVIWAQLGMGVPAWLYPALLALLLLINGGGVLTRAPLYNSRPAAWKALAALIPENGAVSFVDLGAGLGGPLAFIARHRPEATLHGVEASPLVWLMGRIRTAPYRSRCTYRLGSIWGADLRGADIVYAFLSPAPMPEVWAKARREMRPGSVLISHSFEVPGQSPARRVPLPGRKGACLLVYDI